MTRHFSCTACGKCCYGQLPLTWSDAEANAHLLPIGLVWTPVTSASKDFKLTAQMGATLRLPDRKEIAVLIVPTSFIPSTQPCPALKDDKLCGIHEAKPARCRTMPFYPYRDEKFQAEVMRIKDGWECDTSDSAPVVYENSTIIDRKDYDLERQQILREAPMMQRYADYMLKYTPQLLGQLAVAASSPKPKHIVTSLSSFMTAIRYPKMQEMAQKQLPVLDQAISRTQDQPNLSEFLRYYQSWRKEMAYFQTAPLNC